VASDDPDGPRLLDARFEDGDGLVFGNEGSGAPGWLHDELRDWRVTIPHANPELRSLT